MPVGKVGWNLMVDKELSSRVGRLYNKHKMNRNQFADKAFKLYAGMLESLPEEDGDGKP